MMTTTMTMMTTMIMMIPTTAIYIVDVSLEPVMLVGKSGLKREV